MILDHPIVNKYMFFPRSTMVEPSLFAEVEDARIACYLRQPFKETQQTLTLINTSLHNPS